MPDKCLCIKFNSSDLILPLIRVIVSHIFHPLRGSKPLFAASTAPFPLSSCSLGVSLQSYLPDGFDPCPFSPLGPGAHLPLVLSPAVAPVCPHPVAALGVSSRRKSLSASALLGPQTFSRAQGGRSRQSEPSVTAALCPPVPPQRRPHRQPQFHAAEVTWAELRTVVDRVPRGLSAWPRPAPSPHPPHQQVAASVGLSSSMSRTDCVAATRTPKQSRRRDKVRSQRCPVACHLSPRPAWELREPRTFHLILLPRLPQLVPSPDPASPVGMGSGPREVHPRPHPNP